MTTIVETDSVSRIRQSALAEIQRAGILGLRLSDVAAGAGVSVPLIYKYFGDRDGLISYTLGNIIERHFAEELLAIRQLLEKVTSSTILEDILPLMPKPDDSWRRERRWLRLEAKAASREIPGLRYRIAEAMSNVERATIDLVEKSRKLSGNTSNVPSKTVAWMLLTFSDGFTNNDLSSEPITDSDYEPLIRHLLAAHVF